MNSNFFKYIIISIFLIIFTNGMFAATASFSSKIQGTAIYNGAQFSLKDDQYDYMIANPLLSTTLFKNNAVLNRINLTYTGAENKHYTTSWFVETILSVEGWNAAGTAITTQQCTLKISYNPVAQSTYTDVSTYASLNAHYLRVTVLQITSSFPSNVLPNDVMIENEIEVDRTFNMDPAEAMTITNTSNSCVSNLNSNNDVEFQWDYLFGADEYDLEWVFKSAYDNTALNPSNPVVDFSNASRITTTAQFFKLNLIFDNGAIYYRIRGVAKDFATVSKRMEGIWTYGAAPIQVCNMEHRNWTYSATYAEDGKKKEVVSYFDGSQRNRQTVTLSNTENVALITENVYDYEGRSAIQTLPAPSKNYDDHLLFYKNLNLNPSAEPYSKKDFDKDDLYTCEPETIPGMLSIVPGVGSFNMGSSYYYSPQNTQSINNGFGAAIPDAENYPFTHTMFSNKGEVNYQAGVGAAFKTGSGHETRYMNATASQEKLDRLFGNEVGFAEHYNESITVDPNGQISVSYKNLSGKVIATALRGDSPSNVTALNSKFTGVGDDTDPDEQYMTPELLKEDFSGQNQYINSAEAFVIEKDFPVTNTATDYVFTYEITPQTFQSLCSNNMYYNCQYLLQITITDECGNVISEESPASPAALNTIHHINAADYLVTSFQKTFTVHFTEIGVYKIIKTLSLDPAALQQHLVNFEAYLRNPENNTCIDKLADLEEDFEAEVDMSECNTCEQNAAIESKNIPATIINNLGTEVTYTDSIEYKNYLIAQCKVIAEPKTCAELLKTLEDDMSPDGQYFEARISGPYTAYGVSLTFPSGTHLINAISDLNKPTISGTTIDHFYQNFVSYINTNGCNPLPANLIDNSGNPNFTSNDFYTELKNNWDPCWAGYLAQYHPEYCRYERCNQMKTSTDANAYLLSLNFIEATTQPNLTTPFFQLSASPIGSSLLTYDPFFSTISPADATTMSTEMGYCASCIASFPSLTPASNSMWDWADVAPLPIVSTYPSAAYDNERWANFVKLYLSKKATFEKDFGCPAITDNSNPPDNISDITNTVTSFNGYYTFQMDDLTINDPEPLNTINSIATSASPSVAAGPYLSIDTCHYTPASVSIISTSNNGITPAEPGECTTATLCATPIVNALPAIGESIYALYVYSPSLGCYTQISYPVIFPTDWTSPMASSADIINYYNQLKASIDNYQSTPYDFTCDLIYNSSNMPIGYKIVAPASMGLAGNNLKLKLFKCTNESSENYEISSSTCSEYCLNFSGATKVCNSDGTLIIPDCICVQLEQITSTYNIPDFEASTTYSSVAAYAVYTFNQSYPALTTPVTEAQVEYWLSNCETNSNLSPMIIDDEGETTNASSNTEFAVPEAMGCDLEEPCQQQGIDEADFYASEEFEKQIKIAKEDFIKKYKEACLHKTNLAEKFGVEYTEKEYHYTLYYYDQAGNLTRTVPPRAVKRLSPVELYAGTAGANIVNEYRLANQNNPAFTTVLLPNHCRQLQTGNVTSTVNKLVTNYKYNSLNQLIEQETPDAGQSKFWYNDIGQLRFSQNQKQKNAACSTCGPDYNGYYSYTMYDGQGRITEVGENYFTNYASQPFYWYVNGPLFPIVYLPGSQVTKTYYDAPMVGNPVNAQFTGAAQQLLRKRVASVTYEDVDDGNPATFNYNHATHYSYDVHGNVFELVQENPALASLGHSYKKMEYKFDLISGKVNEVNYQKGQIDQFHHRYNYDADNRITSVLTSNNYIHWQQDARYFYYLHGPLARVETGDDKVQASDYAYTLQGWIKNVNTNALQNNTDIGMDGYTGVNYTPSQLNLHKNVAKDVYGYSLDYYTNDYKAINSSVTTNITGNLASSPVYGTSQDLFNGNIKAMSTALYKPNPSALPTQIPTMVKFYNYDQLNRLQNAEAYVTTNHSFSGLTAHSTPENSDYYESFRYDEDGNIKKLKRNAYVVSASNLYDNLTYNYALPDENNQLEYVDDALSTGGFTDDLEDQSANNYEYDLIGNLIKDNTSNITSIEWTVYGKIKKIIKTVGFSSSQITFNYDASGNRISKTVAPNFLRSTTTYYVRDAQGNVMATYESFYDDSEIGSSPTLDLKEQHIYGSSRLGIANNNIDVLTGSPSTTLFNQVKGLKSYELSNHLGNVLTVVSDRKLSAEEGCTGLDFDGNDDLVKINHHSNYNFGTGDFTIEARLKASSTQTDAYPTVISNRNSALGFGSGFVLYYLSGKLTMYMNGNDVVSTTADMRDNTWHHVAVKRESGNVTLYVDGNSIASATSAGNINTNYPLWVGIEEFGPTVTAFKGNINEVRLWNVAKTQTDIDNNKANYLVGNETGLVGYWRMNEGSNQTMLDYTSTSNNSLRGSTTGTDTEDPAWGAINCIPSANNTYYLADVISTTDYYSFGSPMPGRQFNSGDYKYGFNGKEKDDEINVSGGSYDFGARIYDPRIGKWLSTDPLQTKYPYFSPYNFCANNPIYLVDVDGKRIWIYYMEGGKEKHFLYKPGMKVESAPGPARDAVKALNTIHSIENLAVVPTGFNSAEPSPKEVITDLANSTTFKVKIYVLTKEEWKTTKQIGGGSAANALPLGENESSINWSPEIGFVEINDDGTETGLRSSPTTILSHEAKHVWDHFKKRFLNITDKAQRKEAKETSAMETQNRVSLNKPNPEGERTDYSKGYKTVQTDVNKSDGKTKIKRDVEGK